MKLSHYFPRRLGQNLSGAALHFRGKNRLPFGATLRNWVILRFPSPLIAIGGRRGSRPSLESAAEMGRIGISKAL